MALKLWCKVILLLVALVGLLHRAAAECRNESQSCDKCYDTLADSLVNMRNNKFELRRMFYPLRRASPVFMTVTYQYNDSSIPNQTWYWGSGVFYFLQPLEVFQFTSLFFGNPAWRSRELNLTLPAECANASDEFMTELTEQLQLYASQLTSKPSIDNTYKGKGFNLITLRRDLYNDSTFYNAEHPKLLYCFQFLFPSLVIILVLMYIYWWSVNKFTEKHSKDSDSWAITIAHAIISSTFIVYVIALDIAAVIFRDHNTPEYHNEGYNVLLFRLPGVLFLWDILAVVVVIAIAVLAAIHSSTNCVKQATGTATGAGAATGTTTKGATVTFLLLKVIGVVPLLVLASHAHYIIIAWITDPLYATGIGINYAIFYVIHLVVFKYICSIRIKDLSEKKVLCCTAVLLFVAWLTSFSLQALVSVFFVYIPINHSIEDTPSTLLTIIQGIGAVFLGLIAWKVIVDPRGKGPRDKEPRGKGPLSTISDALRKAIQKKNTECKLHDDSEWDGFDDEKKLAEVLHHVIKIYDATPDDQNKGDQNQPPNDSS